MRNLLEIEKNFLMSAQGINFRKVDELQDIAKDRDRQAFDAQLKLAKIVYDASEWFKLESTKEEMYDAGIEFANLQEFNERVFNYKKGWGYKMIQAGKIATDEAAVVTKFKRKCTANENAGETPNRKIDALIAFAKQVEEGTEEQEPKPADKTLFTMSFAKDGLNGAGGASSRVFINGATGRASMKNAGDIEGLSPKTRDLFAKLLISVADDAITFINNQNS